VTKFCAIPELFTTPSPEKVSGPPLLLAVIVNALAPGAKTTLSTSSGSMAKAIVVTFEATKVATSSAPLGIVLGLQFRALFHSPLLGFAFQVALPAKESRMKEKVRIKKIVSLVFIGKRLTKLQELQGYKRLEHLAWNIGRWTFLWLPHVLGHHSLS
jgi:hypothetical protein